VRVEVTQFMKRLFWIVLTSAVVSAGCSRAEPVVDLEAEIEMVRAADRALLEAETDRDLEAAMMFFGEGAILHPPEAPPVIGLEAIRAFYEEWFGIPYTGIYSDSATVVVSSGGDLAYLIGNSHIEIDASAGGGRNEGKYVSLWRKPGGRWLCTFVSWSANLPGD
jgi:ketosteroid isomerase-like protein